MNPFRRLSLVFLIAAISPGCPGGGGSNKPAPTLPADPTTLTALAQTSSRIDLTWIDVADNEFEYRIERSDDGGATWAQIGTAPMNSTVYIDRGLQANTAYFYRVAAWNGKGTSGFAAPANDTTQDLGWTPGSMAGGPALGRAYHSAIYDSSLAGQRMIVFGGIDDGLTFLNDVWSFSLPGTIPATPWAPLTTTGAVPPPLFGHSAIYDSFNNRMIVFGGQAELPNPGIPPPLTILVYQNVVRVLDLGSLVWSTPAVTGTPPSPRAFHTAIYDSANQRMVVHGGNDGGPVEFSDTFVLSLSSATPFAWSAPPMGARPVGRQQHAAVHDPLRSRAVMFGGLDNDTLTDGSILNNETWTLSTGSAPAWTRLFFAGTPSFRMGHTAVYDAANQRMVVFGGDTTTGPTVTNELWSLRLDVTPTWSILNPTVGVPPPGRENHSAIYDSAFNRMIIYGGYDDGATAFNEVWIIQL